MPTKDHYRIGFTPAKKGGAKKQLDQRTFVMNLADLSNLALDKDKQVDSYFKYDAETKNFKFITEEVSACFLHSSLPLTLSVCSLR